MNNITCFLFLLPVLAGAATKNAADGACASEGTCSPDSALDCGVYMAPSTIGNHSNLGIYTAKALPEGAIVNFPEIAIPLLFREWGLHPPSAKSDGELWDRYIWTGDTTDIEHFDDLKHSDRKSVFVPGVGCTINGMLDLNNINSTHSSVYDPVVPRDHPASGSFTPYHSALTTVVMDIPAGTELMATYGDNWIPWIPVAVVGFHHNLDEGDEFLKDVVKWVLEMKNKHKGKLTKDILDRLWKHTVSFPAGSQAFSVLPKEIDWDSILKAANAPNKEEVVVPDTRSYWHEKQTVPMEFLREFGKCQDHMRPDISTIPGVGRGAFAARNLPKGSTVGYSPLIHVGEKFLDFGTIHYNHTTKEYTKPDLVLNYSFGHKDSSLILTPYGAMVNYINHSKEKANVRVQWPTQELVAHRPNWLEEKTVEDLKFTTDKIGLSFDYVALRDIEEGEEIFMDYGDDWQAAWDEHVASWTPPADASDYVHSSNYTIQYLKTPKERHSDPYPSNLHTLCSASFRREGDEYFFLKVLRESHERVHCDVIERQGDSYTVEMQVEDGKRYTVNGVPRTSGIDLYDKAFSQDWHLPQAFRHKIYVPDDIFPEHWKNLRQ